MKGGEKQSLLSAGMCGEGEGKEQDGSQLPRLKPLGNWGPFIQGEGQQIERPQWRICLF